jgi:hypothetical protein
VKGKSTPEGRLISEELSRRFFVKGSTFNEYVARWAKGEFPPEIDLIKILSWDKFICRKMSRKGEGSLFSNRAWPG